MSSRSTTFDNYSLLLSRAQTGILEVHREGLRT
jgi:hypothetical protein